jgi:exodeoxyribonuclease V beta subunit
VRAATLTCFFGWSVTDLARADDDALIDVTLQVRGWRRVLQARGVAALMEAVTRDRDVAARLLGHSGGARRLTDLRHLAELLHDAATRDRLGPGALLEWFSDRVADAHRDAGVEGSRRLDAEGRQVTVVTVHRSKGLQYPIVYLPDAGDRWVSDDKGETLLLHPGAPGDATRAGLVLDVGGAWAPGRPARFARRQAEEASEDLRLLYVALTRAQCQVVTWWAPTHTVPASALQRVLRSGGGVPVNTGRTSKTRSSTPSRVGMPLRITIASPASRLYSLIRPRQPGLSTLCTSRIAATSASSPLSRRSSWGRRTSTSSAMTVSSTSSPSSPAFALSSSDRRRNSLSNRPTGRSPLLRVPWPAVHSSGAI